MLSRINEANTKKIIHFRNYLKIMLQDWQKQILKMTQNEPVPTLFKIKNTTKMNQQQIIKELEELVEMASFPVPYEDDPEQTFRVVEISDIQKLIDKFKNTTK